MTDTSRPEPQWSHEAALLWNDYTDRIRARLENDEADSEEVISDLAAALLHHYSPPQPTQPHPAAALPGVGNR
ncbi:MAG: hypothetical protein WD708_07770 [Kiritimatiellia bacterium]